MYEVYHGKTYVIEGEEVVIRGLTFEEVGRIQSEDYATQLLFCYDLLKFAIVDIPNLIIENARVKYDPGVHFDEVFAENPEFIAECAEVAIKLTFLNEKERETIKSQIYFADFLHENEKVAHLWECRKCVEDKYIFKRKCPRFSAEEIQKIRTHKNYIPDVLLEEDEKIDPIELSGDSAELKPDAKSQIAKRGFKDSIRKNKQKKENNLTEEVVRDKFTLKTELYTWEICPVYTPDHDFNKNISTVFRCLGVESLLVDGGVYKQPFKFLEMTSAVKGAQNEVQNKRMDLSKKESSKSNKSSRGSR